MKNDKVIDILLNDMKTSSELANVVRGLTLAQIVCQRKLMEAFDGGSPHDAVLGIMSEIVETIEHLREQVNSMESQNERAGASS